MSDKLWYPVFLDLEGKRVLVVGAGKVGFRKAAGLVEAAARVTVVAPRFDADFEGLRAERVEREFEDGDLEGSVLVCAATDSREVNRRIYELATARGIPVNVADARDECSFIVPARIHREGLQIAISTGGSDPSRAAAVRRELENWLNGVRR